MQSWQSYTLEERDEKVYFTKLENHCCISGNNRFAPSIIRFVATVTTYYTPLLKRVYHNNLLKIKIRGEREMNAGTKRSADCLIQLIMEAYRADYANDQYRDVKGNIPDMFRELSKKIPPAVQRRTGKSQ